MKKKVVLWSLLTILLVLGCSNNYEHNKIYSYKDSLLVVADSIYCITTNIYHDLFVAEFNRYLYGKLEIDSPRISAKKYQREEYVKLFKNIKLGNLISSLNYHKSVFDSYLKKLNNIDNNYLRIQTKDSISNLSRAMRNYVGFVYKNNIFEGNAWLINDPIWIVTIEQSRSEFAGEVYGFSSSKHKERDIIIDDNELELMNMYIQKSKIDNDKELNRLSKISKQI